MSVPHITETEIIWYARKTFWITSAKGNNSSFLYFHIKIPTAQSQFTSTCMVVVYYAGQKYNFDEISITDAMMSATISYSVSGLAMEIVFLHLALQSGLVYLVMGILSSCVWWLFWLICPFSSLTQGYFPDIGVLLLAWNLSSIKMNNSLSVSNGVYSRVGFPQPAGLKHITHIHGQDPECLGIPLGIQDSLKPTPHFPYTQPIRGWYPKTLPYRWHTSAHSPSTFPYALGSLLLNIYHPYDTND